MNAEILAPAAIVFILLVVGGGVWYAFQQTRFSAADRARAELQQSGPVSSAGFILAMIVLAFIAFIGIFCMLASAWINGMGKSGPL